MEDLDGWLLQPQQQQQQQQQHEAVPWRISRRTNPSNGTAAAQQTGLATAAAAAMLPPGLNAAALETGNSKRQRVETQMYDSASYDSSAQHSGAVTAAPAAGFLQTGDFMLDDAWPQQQPPSNTAAASSIPACYPATNNCTITHNSNIQDGSSFQHRSFTTVGGMFDWDDTGEAAAEAAATASHSSMRARDGRLAYNHAAAAALEEQQLLPAGEDDEQQDCGEQQDQQEEQLLSADFDLSR
jgi:hypothetical protein